MQGLQRSILATLKLAFVFAAIFPPCVSGNVLANPGLAGEWRGGVIIGPQSDQAQPGCVSFNLLERVVTLLTVPGNQEEFRGVWRRHATAFWINNPDGKCSWAPGSALADSFESTLVYSIDGTFDTSAQILKIKTRYRSCLGNACDILPAEARQTLDQTLELRGGSLVDTSVEAQQSVVLLRTADAVDVITSAKRAAVGFDRLIDENQSAQLVRTDLSTWASGSGPQILDALDRLRQVAGRIVFRAPLSELYACVWAGQPTSSSKLVLLIQSASTSSNKQGLEVMVLRQEGEEWKVDFLGFR